MLKKIIMNMRIIRFYDKKKTPQKMESSKYYSKR
ncbi:Uncharacterised protein [Chryseobacterium indoltheticum]|uniref:Uncharacterized protein n=1 Tax=Chryseobacterium indoltheticum TaxID=254 RepID=A0A381FR39_9FLAO|nr:Uncharacterised protein [Chryseobacterium indoltheticum]